MTTTFDYRGFSVEIGKGPEGRFWVVIRDAAGQEVCDNCPEQDETEENASEWAYETINAFEPAAF